MRVEMMLTHYKPFFYVWSCVGVPQQTGDQFSSFALLLILGTNFTKVFEF